MMTYEKISLVKDTINKDDLSELIKWLETNPKLTKGDLTVEFENSWSSWLGVNYSVFLNSGSSANLAMIYSLIISNRLKNNKIIVPAVSWVTTVTPAIQFGLEPILCDCDKDDLGLDSLDCTEILIILNDMFNFNFEVEELIILEIKTVNDFVKCLQK
mgnify:CR=1 FL=1